MTADILAFPPSPAERLQNALERFAGDARMSVVPAPLVSALQAPGVSTVEMTICGVPVVVTVGAGHMTTPEILATWRRLRNTDYTAGAQVLVGRPRIGGAA